ncbi:MAG: Efflux transporter, RND family, MFP subunit [Candidatus Uhrbacteria bacterium GW2011_GWE2_40_58]|nr:MAG: Efflux transporter, RND family, MFP subunit [Candidatus Uhrbacteria bacterium GW2011_GWF2_40_263]KKR67977.1 MAG: Efflux transporter, RND family, MFP subunit [Candidatus Uhrbacteria bacterium GW2011_GWE2_40_58]OGL97013.1 MAG: hypothetical protein A2332_04055 [Candidatus Uhrbacteria bacterium RIFOXYB2_FULL_41_18]HBK34748.1 hypothetical protein [Candidatus Uhrbacteria bacterium]HCB55976.1 hypothetical protein [Candidatus Uhrbacteria bacterium]
MFLKKLLKRWWFWTIIVIVFAIVSGIIYASGKNAHVEMSTQNVERGTFTQTVEVTGELESIDEVELSFDISGTIGYLFVSEGEEVEEGQLLANLQTTELSADVQNTYQAMQIAQANLDQKNAGSTNEALAVSLASVSSAEVGISAAEVSLLNAQTNLSYTELLAFATNASAEASLISAEDAYEKAVSYYADQVDQAYEDLLSSLWSAMIEVRNAISDADEILGIRDGTANDEYELILSNKEQSALNDATSAFYRSEEKRDAIEEEVFALSYDSDQETLLEYASLVEEALDDVTDLLLYTRKVVSATPPSGSFTPTDLSTLKDIVDASRNALQTDLTGVLTARQTVETTELAKETEVISAQNAVEEAQETMAKVEATQASAVASAESSVKTAEVTLALRQMDLVMAQASYAQTSATPRQVDLSALEAEVERTYAVYLAANARLTKAEIRSPIKGRVTDIRFDVGEQMTATKPLLTVQTTEDQFRIVANVTESDIAKISLGDAAIVTFDAFGDDKKVYAYVQEIDLAETLIEGVVYYKVTIYLDDTQSLSLKPGMSADVEIQTVLEENVLIIPQRAVLTHNGNKYVRVLKKNGEIEERTVTVGTRGDLGLILVESGLEEGEEIIIKMTE